MVRIGVGYHLKLESTIFESIHKPNNAAGDHLGFRKSAFRRQTNVRNHDLSMEIYSLGKDRSFCYAILAI